MRIDPSNPRIQVAGGWTLIGMAVVVGGIQVALKDDIDFGLCSMAYMVAMIGFLGGIDTFIIARLRQRIIDLERELGELRKENGGQVTGSGG